MAPLSCLASRITAPGFGENLDNASPRRTAPNEAEVSVHPRGVGTRGQHLPWGQSWPRGLVVGKAKQKVHPDLPCAAFEQLRGSRR